MTGAEGKLRSVHSYTLDICVFLYLDDRILIHE